MENAILERVRRERLRAEFGAASWIGELAIDGQEDGPGWQPATFAVFANQLRPHGIDLTDDLFDRICTAMSPPWEGYYPPDPDAKGMLAAARELGLRVVVCSNTGVRRAADFKRDFTAFGMDGFFDGYVSSLDLATGSHTQRCSKPVWQFLVCRLAKRPWSGIDPNGTSSAPRRQASALYGGARPELLSAIRCLTPRSVA